MPEFFYEGISREGEKIKGTLFAEDETDLRVKLRAQRIRPVKIKEKAFSQNNLLETSSDDKDTLTPEEKIFFVKELAVMLKSGLSLPQALEVIISEGSTHRLRNICAALKNHIDGGMSFSLALSRFPKLFDNMFLNIVASGELRGKLDDVMDEWLVFYQEELNLQKTVNKTALYPLALFGIIVFAFIIILLGIVPVFENIYRAYKIPLPISLLSLVTLAGIIKSHYLFILFGLSVCFILLLILVKSGFVSVTINELILKVPVVSDFMKKVYTLRTVLSITTSLKVGLSLPRALELTAESIDNMEYEELLLKAKEAASKQEAVGPFFARSRLFKAMIVQIISVAEIMGSIPDMLKDLIPYLKEDVKKTSDTLSSVIEPLVLVMGGLIIGMLLASFYLPLLSIVQQIK